MRRPAVAALGAAVLVTGAGVAAANDWLPIFRTEQVDPVTISSTDLVQVPDLSAYGDLEVTQEPDPRAGGRRRDRAGAHRARRARGGRAARGRHRGPDLPGGRRRPRHVHLLRREGRAGRGRRGRGPAARARRARRQRAADRGRSGRRGRVVAADRCADARRRPGGRAEGRLDRRQLRDGARLPALAPGHPRRASPTSCATSPPRAAPCRCRCRPSWSPAPRPT